MSWKETDSTRIPTQSNFTMEIRNYCSVLLIFTNSYKQQQQQETKTTSKTKLKNNNNNKHSIKLQSFMYIEKL